MSTSHYIKLGSSKPIYVKVHLNIMIKVLIQTRCEEFGHANNAIETHIFLRLIFLISV